MAYSLDPLSDGCYENSSVLINKFDIRDEKQLDEIEQSLTAALIAKAMMEIPFENVDFSFYKKLHQYVFSDIYDWAGQQRRVNMSKKGNDFCPVEDIASYGNKIFEELKRINYLRNLSDDDFLDELTELYCNLNYLHPFREGNGRIQRMFISMLVEHNGKTFDLTQTDKDLFMIATIKAFSGDMFLLKEILKEAIK